MDLSKLPRLSDSASQTPPPPPQSEVPPAPPQPVTYSQPGTYHQPHGISPDIWFNTVVGIILLFVGRSFASWLIATLTGQTFHTGVEWTQASGNSGEVPYFQLQGYTAWTDAGLFIFGVVVLLEALCLALYQTRPAGPSRALVLAALALTVLCTALNLVLCIVLMSHGVFPLFSALAVAFGGYIISTLRFILRPFTPPGMPRA